MGIVQLCGTWSDRSDCRKDEQEGYLERANAVCMTVPSSGYPKSPTARYISTPDMSQMHPATLNITTCARPDESVASTPEYDQVSQILLIAFHKMFS